MTYRELCEKVRAGEVVLDYAGHDASMTRERLLESYDRIVGMSEGSHDGEWDYDDKVPAEVDARMRNHHLQKLNYEVGDEPLTSFAGFDNITCRGCGESLYWVFAVDKLAFGQMSNMSVGIFLHPGKESVIVGDLYDGDMKRKIIDGHKYAGRIILDVWRWEATGVANLQNYEKVRRQNRSRGVVEAEVTHGTWLVEHYFREEGDGPVYSTLKLKKPTGG